MIFKLPITATAPFCPSQIRDTVPVSLESPLWTRFRRYAGIGFLISVGYMDPGNWATDIEAGSHFGYGLLSVVLISSLVAMVLQTLCVRMGMASGKDLAQLCREQFPPRWNFMLWFFAQIAIIACDFAEVLGTALALKLLFGMPLTVGVLLTAFDTVIVLLLQSKGVMRLETIVMVLVLIIGASFVMQIIISKPSWPDVVHGLFSGRELIRRPESWLVAVGILGATVMPHNLYLHSSAVGSRKLFPGIAAKADAIRLMTLDTVLTLTIAFFINAAILVVAASAFHFSGHSDITRIDDAYYLMSPILGVALASTVFALALFASGQSSTLTGTIAGQVILEGFLDLKIPCWQQRLFTRLTAILPAWAGVVIYGDASLERLLIWSQVVLSMQLPFAIVPLLLFNSDPTIMGPWRMKKPAALGCWLLCLGIIGANLFLVYSMLVS